MLSFLTVFGKGFLSTLFKILSITLNIPIWLILASILGGIYIKNTAVGEAVRQTIIEITAKAELEALEHIIRNKDKLIEEQEKEIEEQRIMMELNARIMRELEEQAEIEEKELKEAMDKLDALSNQPPPDACVVDESILNRLRNQ